MLAFAAEHLAKVIDLQTSMFIIGYSSEGNYPIEKTRRHILLFSYTILCRFSNTCRQELRGGYSHRVEMDSKEEESECPTSASPSNNGVVESEEEQPAYIRRLSRVPLVAHILVLAMCTLYATVSSFVKIIDTMDSWQIASHRNVHIHCLNICYVMIRNFYINSYH